MIKKIAINITLLLVSTAVTLVAAEYGARWWFRPTDQEYSASTGNSYKHYQYNKKFGWGNAPGTTGSFGRKNPFDFSINDFGMRQAPVSLEPKKGMYRIAFLGDSFVWGINVVDKDRFTDIIGTKPGIEALNFGVSGYGPIQYYLLLDQVARFKPDLVVIMFTPSNDFGDNTCRMRYGRYKPYAALDETGKLQIKGYPIPNRDTKSENSILLEKTEELFETTMSEEHGLCFKDILMYEKDLPSAEQQKVEQAVAINKALFAAIKSTLDAQHIPLLVVVVPTKWEYHSHGRAGERGLNLLAVTKVEQSLQELHINFLDPVSKLSLADFWPTDGHWNVEGHQKMADAIYQYLNQKHYLPKDKPH